MTDREDWLETVLRRRSAALGRAALENDALRAGLLRVLERAQVGGGPLAPEEVHDAIGHELIFALQRPGVRVEWGTPVPRPDFMKWVDAQPKPLHIAVQEMVDAVMRRERACVCDEPTPAVGPDRLVPADALVRCRACRGLIA